jgi:nitrous oxidase accessory protein NosD
MTGLKTTMIVAIILAILLAFLLAGTGYFLFPDQHVSQPKFTIILTVPLSPIYIDNNGTVNPSTAPIQRTGDTYTLTEGIINYTIVVQRDNIIIDGTRHTLRGYVKGKIYGSEAIELNGRSNVTIKNMIIEQFWKGIVAQSSSNIIIRGNNIRNLGSTGIALDSCNNTIIAGNNINNMATAIDISNSNGLYQPSNNTIVENTLTNAISGIQIHSGFLNNITNNNFADIYNPIWVASNSTTISKNAMKNGIDGISIGGAYYDDNGNYTGGSYCVIFGNRVENFSWSGISISLSINSTIYANNLANNKYGVMINPSVQWTVENNTFYHNNFVNNTEDVLTEAPQYVNFWDNGKEGNYWSNYNGTDANSDGIGDTPYPIDANNTDRYPLMTPYGNWEIEQSLLNQILWAIRWIGLAAFIAIAVVGTMLLINRIRHKEH